MCQVTTILHILLSGLLRTLINLHGFCTHTHVCARTHAHRLVGQKLNRKKYFMDWTNINTVHVHKIIIFMLVISTPEIITARAGSNYVHCNCNCN